MENALSILANIAQTLTGVVAVYFGVLVMFRSRARMIALENYLKDQRAKDMRQNRNGLRSVLHLMSHLAMTEAQVLDAAFSSTKVKRWTTKDDETGRADALFFQFDERGGSND